MGVKFPTTEFLQALADRMAADRATFEKPGYCGTPLAESARILEES